MRIYLDASALIYAIEGVQALRDPVLDWMRRALADASGQILTSRLSRLECRVKPLRDGNAELLSLYDGLFGRLTLLELSPDIVDRATELRARLNLQTPDALHAATAIDARADVLVTGDVKLKRVPDLNVEIVAAN